LREEFAFNGIHCDAHNAAFVVESWPVAPAPTINKHSIPGRHGTIRYPGTFRGEQALTGMLYLLSSTGEVISYADMLTRKTAIAAWLCPGGRKRLILDAAPDRFYMAEIEQELTISTDEWGNGCIHIVFSVQPFTYATVEDVAETTLAADTAKNVSLTLKGNQPAPLAMELTASAALTWAQLTLGGKTIRLEGMSLASGQKAIISYDLEAGEVMAITHNGAAGMRYLAASSKVPFEAQAGSNTISARSSAASALKLTARGRWL
jgi:phage-related protein